MTFNVIGIIISCLALCLSLFNFWYSHFRGVQIFLEKENQIQLLEQNPVLAFNILFIINAVGSENKWSYIRFNNALVTFPDGHTEDFKCMSYLLESGTGQKNESRNVPISIKGGESITKTVAFQNNIKNSKLKHWIEGQYKIEITAEDINKNVYTKSLSFSISTDELAVIQNPRAIVMFPTF